MRNKLNFADTGLPPVAHAYVRLSRDDLRQPGTLSEKFELRARICTRLATEAGLLLPPENIVVERESGGKLSNRQGLIGLLTMARRGNLPHLITAYIDRLLRGDKRDEQDIEDALCIGQTRVYTAEQSHPIEFGPNYDPTLFEIKAFVARSELRGTIKKRKETDLARLKMGIRSRGKAPYGYQYLRPVFDALGRQVSPAQHVVIPEQFEVAAQIFRRARFESCAHICVDLNARGVPAPALGKRPDASPVWRPETMRAMLANPFYAGYIAQRYRNARGTQIVLPVSEFILADNPGEWPPILPLPEWYELQSIIGDRASGAPPSSGLLTGILFNWCGGAMSRKSRHLYICRCSHRFKGQKNESKHHAGENFASAKIEDWARRLVSVVIEAMPGDLFGEAAMMSRRRGNSGGTTARTSLILTQREIAEKRRQAEEMMLRRGFFVQQFGEEMYESAVVKLGKELTALQEAAQRLEAESRQPDLSEALPIIGRVREIGVDIFWEAAPLPARIALTHAIIQRLDVSPKLTGKGWHQHPPAVTLWPWAAPYAPETPPPMPLYYRSGTMSKEQVKERTGTKAKRKTGG